MWRSMLDNECKRKRIFGKRSSSMSLFFFTHSVTVQPLQQYDYAELFKICLINWNIFYFYLLILKKCVMYMFFISTLLSVYLFGQWSIYLSVIVFQYICQLLHFFGQFVLVAIGLMLMYKMTCFSKMFSK